MDEHPLAKVDDDLSESELDRLLHRVGSEATFSALVAHYSKNQDDIERVGKVAKLFKVPIPVLESVLATRAFRRAMFNSALHSVFDPSTLTAGFNNLAKRLTDGRTSTRDIIAILRLLGDMYGIETKQKVTHEFSGNAGISIHVVQADTPRGIFGDAIDAEFHEVNALPEQATGAVVQKVPKIAGSDDKVGQSYQREPDAKDVQEESR